MTGRPTYNQWPQHDFRPKVQASAAADIPQLANDLVEMMLRHAAMNDVGAEKDIADYLHSQAETRVKAWSRNANTITTKVRGRQQRKASRYSFTEFDQETGDLKGRNHRSLWDVPIQEFEAKMREIDQQHVAITDTTRIMHAIWTTWQEHQEAATARAAWTAAGYSTSDIDLDSIAT